MKHSCIFAAAASLLVLSACNPFAQKNKGIDSVTVNEEVTDSVVEAANLSLGKPDKSESDNKVPATLYTPDGLFLMFGGQLGTADDTHMALYDGFGGFSYGINAEARARRYVSVKSYDHESGTLVMEATDCESEQKTGQFEGVLYRRGEKLIYEGTFTNVKGVKIDFNLHGEYSEGEPEGDWSDGWWY